MTKSIFDNVRRMVPARVAAESCGFAPNRGGFIRCPFHGERTPSLKLYENGTWHCFGCGAGGSSIDFVARLFGLTPLEAARKLNDDFHLGLPLDRKQTTQERAEAARAAEKRRALSDTAKAFEAWRGAMLDKLTACFRLAHLTMKGIETQADFDRLTDAQALTIREQAYLGWLADTLTGGTMAQQMDIFRERQVIQSRIEQILNRTSMKSGAT